MHNGIYKFESTRLLFIKIPTFKHHGICRSASSSADQSTAKPILTRSNRSSHLLESKHFDDFKLVKVIGGKGGDGIVTFLSEYARPFGGADGGDGGNGGHVIFKGTSNKTALNHLMPVLKAPDGEDGKSKNCYGKNADHLIVEVPVGSVIKHICKLRDVADTVDWQNIDASNARVIADLSAEGDQVIIGRGGVGGHGNNYFMSSDNTAPAFAEFGGDGEKRMVSVELKVMAHAGLVGFPNAGKSSLLRAISRARPKVASYPFTTLNPHVGMVLYEDHQQLAVADIPGIIPDAHKNRGLGISFLRHIERCLCLWYVIDVSRSDPVEQLEHLRHELSEYNAELSGRPSAIVANKIDADPGGHNLQRLTQHVLHRQRDATGQSLSVFPVSAKQRLNLTGLLIHLRALYDQHLMMQRGDTDAET